MTLATPLIGLSFLSFLMACKPGASAPPDDPRIGELVCAEGYCPATDCDSASAKFPSHLPLPACPVLVVGTSVHRRDDREIGLRIVGPFGLQGWVASGIVEVFGKSGAGDSLFGATDEVYPGESGFLGLRFPSRENPYHQVGLVFGRGTRKDTTTFLEAPGLRTMPPAPASAATCMETIRGTKDFGLTHAPLLPVDSCSLVTTGHWVVKDDSGSKPTWSSERTKCTNLDMAYKGKDNGSGVPLFLKLECGLWLLSDGPGSNQFIRFESSTADPEEPREEDVVHVSGVEAVDLDEDGRYEWLVETSRIYGDGSYLQLVILSFAKPGSADSKSDHGTDGTRLFSRVLGVSGSSGEEGGSTVEGTWWASQGQDNRQYVFIATAEVGNEQGVSQDLALKVLTVDSKGSIKQSKADSQEIVFFGGPVSSGAAQTKSYMINRKNEQARTAGIRPLPWRVGEELLWRPGVVAVPGREAAPDYASWSDSAIKVKIPIR